MEQKKEEEEKTKQADMGITYLQHIHADIHTINTP
jgi:hypothetical protein